MRSLLLALFLFLPQSLSTSELVGRVSDKYGKLDSLSADFEQLSTDSSNQIGRSRGHVYLKKGKRALFQYDSPTRQFEYFDNKYYTNYKPGLKQAQRFPINKAADERLTIFLILGNPDSPWREQFPTMARPKDSPVMNPGNQMALLIPKNKKDVPEMLVEVDPNTLLIHRFVSTRADGARDEFKFTNIKTAPLEDSVFKFVPPPGVVVFEDK
jgi:chaperone LolA